MAKVVEINLQEPPVLLQSETGAATKAQAYSLDVPLLATEPIKITSPTGAYFSWKPTELCYKDSAGQYDYIVGSSPVSLSVLNRQAKYRRTFPQADDIFNAEKDRVKHWVILNEPPRAPADYLGKGILFGISGIVNGCPLPVGIHESINADPFNLPKPIIKDLKGYEISGFYEVVDTDDGQQLFLWFDVKYLSTAVYPVMIDPTVVVSSAYTISTTGRPQKLSNGWLVTAEFSSSNNCIYFQVSKDNGSTFTPLCNTGGVLSSFSVCSKGTIIYCLCQYDNNMTMLFYTFDATIVTNITISPTNSIDWSQTSLGAGCDINVSSDGTKIGASWCSKNATYPNSNNIRYAEGTINADYTVTWGSPQQITNMHNSSYYFTNPVISFDSNNIPLIVCDSTGIMSTGTYIAACYIVGIKHNTSLPTTWFLPSGWSGVFIGGYDDGYHVQSKPYHIVKRSGANIGRIWDLWQGYSPTVPSTYHVYGKYSDDNGITWSSSLLDLGAGQNVTLSEKPNGDIVAIYDSGGNVVSQICANGGTTLGSVTTIASSGTNPAIMPYGVNNIIGYIWQTSTSILFDKIVLNQPPLSPTNLTRTNFDATKSANFTWTFNDPNTGDYQSAFQLQILKASDGSTAYDTGKMASTLSTYTLLANILTNNTQYQWKVTTWDNSDIQGAWSSLAIFKASGEPSCSIISPANDGDIITESSVTAKWSFSDPESAGQSAYQLKLTDSADNILWDSSKISDISARERTVEYTLLNNTSYKIKLTVWDADDVQSDEVIRTISVSFTPPIPANITVSTDITRGSIILDITNYNQTDLEITRDGLSINPLESYNPVSLDVFAVDTLVTIDGGEYDTSDLGTTDFQIVGDQIITTSTSLRNDIYRRIQGESVWTRIKADYYAVSPFTDYTPESSLIYEYMVRTWGDNGVYIDSDIVSANVVIQDTQLALASDPTKYVILKLNPSRSEKQGPKGELMQFAGRIDPVVEFDDTMGTSLPLSFTLNNKSDLDMLQSLINSKQTLLYRDSKGRKIYCCVIDSLDNADIMAPNAFTGSWTVNFTIYKVSYDEEV